MVNTPKTMRKALVAKLAYRAIFGARLSKKDVRPARRAIRMKGMPKASDSRSIIKPPIPAEPIVHAKNNMAITRLPLKHWRQPKVSPIMNEPPILQLPLTLGNKGDE